jgi:hypothetical protein
VDGDNLALNKLRVELAKQVCQFARRRWRTSVSDRERTELDAMLNTQGWFFLESEFTDFERLKQRDD